MRLFQSKPHLGVVLLGSWLITTGILDLVGRARELSMVSQELGAGVPGTCRGLAMPVACDKLETKGETIS